MLPHHLKLHQLPAACILLSTLIPIFFSASWCRLTLVTTTYPPFSDCSKYNQSSESSSVFGAEVNLIRSALNSLNWTEGIDYAFECVYGSEALRSRIRNPKIGDLGVFGGIAISHSRLQRGFKFSQPTLSESVPLVHRKVNHPWFFTRSFTMITWMLVFLTVFAVGGVLYFMEDKKSEWVYMLYNVALQFFFAPDFPMTRFTSKLIQLFSLFLATILVYIFTALSTNIFNADRGAGVINSLSDLSKYSIMTNKMLGYYMNQYSSKLVIIEPKDLTNPVERYDFDYMILDGPYANHLIRQHCELSIVFQQIDVINYGLVFTSSIQKEIQAQINEGILKAKEKKTFDAYTEDYYSAKANMLQCSMKYLAAEKVTLNDARSLWYIYLAGLGISIIMMTVNYLKGKVKKNLNMYNLKGVRAKRDKTVQRRIATSIAMYAGISLQAIGFLKRISQEAVNTFVIGTKINPPGTVLEFAHSELLKKLSDKGAFENADQSGNPGNSNTFRKSFLAKMKRHLSLRNSSEKGKIPEKSTKKLKNSITRRSSLLLQSMQSYQLAKTLTSKTIIFSDQSLRVDSDVNSVELLKKSQTIDKRRNNSIISDESKETKKVKKSLPLWQKLFGKKGIKVNKSMVLTATNLLKTKEGILMEELNRKKSEVSSIATSFSTTSLSRARTLNNSPKNGSRILQPSIFKVKFLEDKGTRSRAEDISDADSSELSCTEDLRQSDIVSFEAASRSQAPLASRFQRYHLQRKERSKRRIFGRPFEEEYDYEAQAENVSSLEPSTRRFSAYDFSKIVKMKTKRRSLLK